MKKVIFFSFDETIIEGTLNDIISETLEFYCSQSLSDLKTIQSKFFDLRYAEISKTSGRIKNDKEISVLLHRLRECDSIHFGLVNSVDSCEVLSLEYINRTLKDELNLSGVDVVLSNLDVIQRSMYGHNIAIVLSLFDLVNTLDLSTDRGDIEIILVDGNQHNIDCFNKLSDSNHVGRCIRYIRDNKLRDNFELLIDGFMPKLSEFNFVSSIHAVEGKDYISRISRFLSINSEDHEVLKMDNCQSSDSFDSELVEKLHDGLSTTDTQSRKKNTIAKILNFINPLKFINRGRGIGYSIVPESSLHSSDNSKKGFTFNFLGPNTAQRRYSILSNNSTVQSSQNDNFLSETQSCSKDQSTSRCKKVFEDYCDNFEDDYKVAGSLSDLNIRERKRVMKQYSHNIKKYLEDDKSSRYMLLGSLSQLNEREKRKLEKELLLSQSSAREKRKLSDDNQVVSEHLCTVFLGKANYGLLNGKKSVTTLEKRHVLYQRRKEKSDSEFTVKVSNVFGNVKNRNCVSLENIPCEDDHKVQSLISNSVNEPLTGMFEVKVRV